MQGGLLLKVPTSFHLKGLEGGKSELERIFSQPIFGIEIERRPRTAERRPEVSIQQITLPLPPKVAEHRNTEEDERKRRYSAPYFVTSPAFDIPHQLVCRWAQGLSQATRSQALWVHGRAGSGKTQLLKQLHEWVPLAKRLNVVDVMSFFHEWRRSIESKENLTFHKKYRKDVDVFVLENLDDLQGKIKTQEELLYTVNAILDRGGAIVVSSTLHPVQMREILDPGLFSRLFSGLAVEMPEPDRSFKEKLWRHLLEQHGLGAWPCDLMVQERLLGIRVDTARKANSVFINAIGRLSLRKSLSLGDLAEIESVHGMPAAGRSNASPMGIAPTEIIEKVARLCGVGPSALQGKVRRRDVTLARHFVCLALSRFLGLTNASIANFIEKDPSTVCHALKTIEVELESDRHVARQWTWICSQLGLEPMPAE